MKISHSDDDSVIDKEKFSVEKPLSGASLEVESEQTINVFKPVGKKAKKKGKKATLPSSRLLESNESSAGIGEGSSFAKKSA